MTSSRARARGIVAAAAILFVALVWLVARPAQRAGDVPYVATRPEVIDRMLELAEVGPEDLVVDLGSGDGRIVLRAATRYGARGRGVEIDPAMVRDSRAAAHAMGLGERVEFVEGDLFAADLRDATAVTMFLLPTVNLRLRPRLLAQLAPGTPVVSHMWDMGVWSPDRREVVALEPPAEIYLWIVPAAIGGEWEIEPPASRPGTRSPEGVTLRLRQRFQDIEGELVVDGRAGGVAGVVRGEGFSLQRVAPDSGLGQVTLSGRVRRERLEVIWEEPDGAATTVAATRRPVRIEGVWEVAGEGGSAAPAWTMQWREGPSGWTVSRWKSGAARTPSEAEVVAEVYVWGGSVAFFIPEPEGSARRVGYYGLVSGDRMIGVAHDGSRRASWTARRSDQTR